MKKRKTFKQILADTPKPKKLFRSDDLPYYFDLMWDAKTGEDIMRVLETADADTKADIRMILAEFGYDTKNL